MTIPVTPTQPGFFARATRKVQPAKRRPQAPETDCLCRVPECPRTDSKVPAGGESVRTEDPSTAPCPAPVAGRRGSNLPHCMLQERAELACCSAHPCAGACHGHSRCNSYRADVPQKLREVPA